jgi:hypothetical protein
MDDPRVSSATRPNTLPSIQIHVPSSNVDRRSASRSSPYTTDHQHSRGPNPMPIPNARQEVPPPLPPPRYLSDLTPGGEDLAWEYANSPTSFDRKSYASINPSSSLLGGYGIPSPKFKSTAEISLRDARPRHFDEGYHSLSSLALTPPKLVFDAALCRRSHLLLLLLLSFLQPTREPWAFLHLLALEYAAL